MSTPITSMITQISNEFITILDIVSIVMSRNDLVENKMSIVYTQISVHRYVSMKHLKLDMKNYILDMDISFCFLKQYLNHLHLSCRFELLLCSKVKIRLVLVHRQVLWCSTKFIYTDSNCCYAWKHFSILVVNSSFFRQ